MEVLGGSYMALLRAFFGVIPGTARLVVLIVVFFGIAVLAALMS